MKIERKQGQEKIREESFINNYLRGDSFPNQDCLSCSPFFVKDVALTREGSNNMLFLGEHQLNREDLLRNIIRLYEKGGGSLIVAAEFDADKRVVKRAIENFSIVNFRKMVEEQAANLYPRGIINFNRNLKIEEVPVFSQNPRLY